MQEASNQAPDSTQGFAILTALVCSVTRTVHLFSRWPGSCGMWHFGVFYLIGFTIQLVYYQANVESSGQFDAVDDRLFIFANIGMLGFHNLAGWYYWFKGNRNHSWSPGVGILIRLMPKSDEVFVALASDLFVASLLGTIFYRANCPILAGWYFSMIFWCIISHCLLSMRHWLQMQRLQDAQIEQKAWAHEVEEQRRWSQMQRERWGDRHH